MAHKSAPSCRWEDVDNTHDLSVLLASRHPLLFVATPEEERFLTVLEAAARSVDAPVWEWSATLGLRRADEEAQYGTTDLRAALDFIGEITAPAIFVLSDAGPALAGPVALRRLKEVARGAKRGQTMIVTGASVKIPAEIANIAHAWTLKPPNRDELADLAKRTLSDFHARGFPIHITKGELGQLAGSLVGMTLRESERIIQRAVVSDGRFDAKDLAGVRATKAEILNQDGVLEIIEAHDGTFEDIGGLEDLKEWLMLREPVFRGIHTGVDLPKGILLTGVPGCGKSLVAKTIASAWGVPLILLDPARLYSKYVGESESRLNSALKTIEAMSPVVVWIDEIEKGFAHSESDGGVSMRILGTFLRWLQDRQSNVFTVATANNVASLPPELLRSGRFDQVFFVDLPDQVARQAILRTHLTRRHQVTNHLDLDKLVEITEGFSGAEIETAVVGATYRAFGQEGALTTDLLVAEITSMVPLSISRADDIGRLREWAHTRAAAA